MYKITNPKFILIVCLLLRLANGYAQQISQNRLSVVEDEKSKKDIVDVIKTLPFFKKHTSAPSLIDESKPHLTIVPGAGYTLQTGFAVLLASNLVFYTDKSNLSKTSTIFTSIAYTQKSQVILPLFANIWSKGNEYNFISDNRYMNYPSLIYGLGPKSLESSGKGIDYSYLKLHETCLKRVARNTYLGGGVFYDYFWNISEMPDAPPSPGKPTMFKKYGSNKEERAVGIVIKALYDSRTNQVNPPGGFFASVLVRNNLRAIGSHQNWISSQIELKKYITFPVSSKNILAFWSYNALTLTGRPPYLLLPSTGWDDFFNTGRGYIQGRFRGSNLFYLETEYRIQLLRNGLLGGVVFANVQTFSKDLVSNYNLFLPGYGLGLRIKMNKQSSTNLCIDYGFGINGSQGFFVNLGEVF